MSCMEHICNNCGHMIFNNNFLLTCPKCESSEVTSHWDEQDSYDRDEEEDDYE